MKVLVACEFSGIVRDAFTRRGHYAMSCDLMPSEKPGRHYQGDVMDILDWGWDLMIAHPPCTYLSRGSCRWLFPKGQLNKERYAQGLQAKKFFLKLLNANIPKIAVENPFPHKIFGMPKESQTIQLYQFGHEAQKATLLWLKNLPLLTSTNTIFRHIQPEYYVCNKGWKHSKFTANWDAKKKSRTFQGIADAMADQWT